MTANRSGTITRRGFLLGIGAAIGASQAASGRSSITPHGVPRVSLPDLPVGYAGAGHAVGAAWAQQLWGGSLLGSPAGAISGGGIAATISYERDRTVVEFTFRIEALFSDGTPVTALDVVSSLEHARDLAAEADEEWRWEHVRRFDVTAERSVQGVLDEPDPSLAATLASHWAPIIPAVSIRNGWNDATGPFPPASGAFLRVPASPNRVACLRNSSFYLMGRPQLAGLISVPPSAGVSRAVELATGDVDLVIDAPLLEVPTLRENPAIALSGGPANALCMLSVNLQQSVLSNRRVRQILDRAIDRVAIAAAATAGEATPATTLIDAGHWAGLDAPLEPLEPAEGRTALDALGVEQGQELRLLVDAQEPSTLNAAVLLQDQLAYLGLSLTLNLQNQDGLRAVTQSGDWELRIVRTPFWHDPHELVRPLLVTGARDNIGNYQSSRLDYLVGLARRAGNEAFRGEHYRTVQRIIQDDVPVIPLYFPHYFDAMSTRLQGYQVYPPISARAMNQVFMPRSEPEGTP